MRIERASLSSPCNIICTRNILRQYFNSMQYPSTDPLFAFSTIDRFKCSQIILTNITFSPKSFLGFAPMCEVEKKQCGRSVCFSLAPGHSGASQSGKEPEIMLSRRRENQWLLSVGWRQTADNIHTFDPPLCCSSLCTSLTLSFFPSSSEIINIRRRRIST